MYVTEELMTQANVQCACDFFAVFSKHDSSLFWVKPPLEPGQKRRIFALLTGERTPYTVPDTMDLYIIGYWVSASQPSRVEWRWNGQVSFNMFNSKNSWQYEYGWIKQATKDGIQGVDPPYVLDFIIKNTGKKPLEGTFAAYGILLKKED
jgi:hypothetical protein